MHARSGILMVVAVATGCADVPWKAGAPAPSGTTQPAEAAASAPGTAAAAPPPSAVTVEQFDTTSAAERAAAAKSPSPPSEVRLGATVASLGDPSDPGFWAVTGLVTEITQGRLEYPAAGTSVKVELRPSGGEPGSGTRVSLPALRVLEAPLTALPELVVFGS